MAKEMNMQALQANLTLLDKRAEMATQQAIANGEYDPRLEKLGEALQDAEFCQRLIASETSEEARGLLAERGVEMTEQAVGVLGQTIARITRSLVENGGELSEEELEQIAGGALGLSETESCLSGVVGAGGAIGGGMTAGYYGFLAGSTIFPGVGSVIGAVVGALGGVAVGMAGGGSAGYFGTAGAIKGVKKLGKWIKSWF